MAKYQAFLGLRIIDQAANNPLMPEIMEELFKHTPLLTTSPDSTPEKTPATTLPGQVPTSSLPGKST